MDTRLFKVLGQQEAYELILKQKEKAKNNTVEDILNKFIQKREKEPELDKAQIWHNKVRQRFEAEEAKK